MPLNDYLDASLSAPDGGTSLHHGDRVSPRSGVQKERLELLAEFPRQQDLDQESV